jgi:hypothetical protein
VTSAFEVVFASFNSYSSFLTSLPCTSSSCGVSIGPAEL